MADNKNKKVVDLIFWSMWALTFGSRVAALFATRISRLLIVALFIGVTLFTAFQQVWKPILATVSLPPGVTGKSTQLDIELLKTINAQRVERVEAPRQQFSVETLLRPPPLVQ